MAEGRKPRSRNCLIEGLLTKAAAALLVRARQCSYGLFVWQLQTDSCWNILETQRFGAAIQISRMCVKPESQRMCAQQANHLTSRVLYWTRSEDLDSILRRALSTLVASMNWSDLIAG